MGGKFKIKKQLSQLDLDSVNVSDKHSFGLDVMEVKSMTKSDQQSVPVGMDKLLNEGKRDEALGMFLPLFKKRGIEMNVSRLKQLLLNKFVTEAGINSLSQGSNYYLLGVARYYFSGELTSNTRLNALYPQYRDRFIPDVCRRLDVVVNILRNSYVDSVGTKFELPEDFGTLSLDTLLRKYRKAIDKELGIGKEEENVEKGEVSQRSDVNGDYSYEILYSFDDAKKYKQYTDPGAWCITYAKQHYDYYAKTLNIHYVIFKKAGFENIPRKKGPNWSKRKPQDEYGNSLIALLQSNSTGEPVYITSRWNHGTASDGTSCEADHAYTKEEFFKVTGCDDSVLQRIFAQWKSGSNGGAASRKELNAKKVDALRTFKYAQMLINGGGDVRSIVKIDFVIRDSKNLNGTYLVYIEKGEDLWYTVMDRKKMFYDVYLVKSSNSRFSLNLTSSRGKNFTVLVDNVKRYYIFDHMHHQFVDLDGHSCFKYVSGNIIWADYVQDVQFAVLGLRGNQEALFDMVSMNPIKSNGGSCWFESITKVGGYGMYTTSQPYTVDGDILKMVYDSASEEVYYYNTNNHSFIEIKNEDGYHLSRSQVNTNMGYLTYVRGEEDIANRPTLLKKVQNAYNNEWLVVNGYDTFKDIVISEARVVGYKGYDEDVSHYIDMDSGKMLMVNGKPIETITVSFSEAGGYLAISLSMNETGSFWHKVVLFNPINRTMFHDDINGWYFRIYGASEPTVYYPNDDKHTYNLPNAEESARMADKEKENVTDRFNDMVNRMNR